MTISQHLHKRQALCAGKQWKASEADPDLAFSRPRKHRPVEPKSYLETSTDRVMSQRQEPPPEILAALQALQNSEGGLSGREAGPDLLVSSITNCRGR